MDESRVKHLGPPDLKVLGFQLWISGREFRESQDYNDGNWLNITAHCGGGGSSAWVTGPYICLSEIQGWLKSCETLAETKEGTAELETIEPELNVLLNSKSQDSIEMEVTISHQPYSQQHKSAYELKLTHLNTLIQDLKAIMDKYPIRGCP
jgi:hypothetical protein